MTFPPPAYYTYYILYGQFKTLILSAFNEVKITLNYENTTPIPTFSQNDRTKQHPRSEKKFFVNIKLNFSCKNI